MPRDLILHIGTSKTGSTSIQHMLDINRGALLAQGICYPATPAGNTHILLAAAFTSFTAMYNDTDNPMWLGRKPEAAIDSHLAELESEIAGLPDSVSRIILSCEQFSMYQRTAADIGRLRDFVGKLADRCTVVVYLRRQDEHFASLYSQFLRLGSIDEPDMDRLHPFHQDYDYADFMGRWADAFGQENVRPRIFERPVGGRFDVLADFAGVSGFDLAQMKLAREADKNQSITQAGQQTLRRVGLRLRAVSPDRPLAGPVWQRVGKAVSDTSPGKGWLPSKAKARAFMERYAASNEAVRAAYFPERPALFQANYAALPDEEEVASPDAVQAATVDALIALLKQGATRELQLLLEKARLAERLGDGPLRRNTLVQAVRLDGKDATARLRFAECLADQGDLAGARGQLSIAAKLAPEAPGVGVLRRRLA